MEQLLEFFKITGPWAAGLLGVWLILNIIGEILEKKNKIVPEFMKIRKYFKRKKEEKNEILKFVRDMKVFTDDIKIHYSPESLKRRDDWMDWVNSRADKYDSAVQELKDLKDDISRNNVLTLDLYININRHRIIDFASKVANENILISKEEFNRIFKVYDDYEAVLAQHNMTNGEVDIAIRVIRDAYKDRLRDGTFLENVRGYASNE
jgi:hypothetical protein